MNNEKLEDQIKEWLEYETKEVKQMTEQMWDRIEPKLKKKTNPKYKWFGATAAALLIVSFGFTTPGQAAIGTVKDWFVPEKKIVQHIEGTPEETDVKVNIEEKLNYAIYIDENKYLVTNKGGIMRIVPNMDLSKYPEVSMEISQVKDKKPQDLIEETKATLQKTYKNVTVVGDVNAPIKAKLVKAISGNKWDSVIERFYLVDDTKAGTYVIKQKFFLEAEEGHGARFGAMLEEFKIIES